MEEKRMQRGNFQPPKQMKHRLFTLKRNGPNKIYRLKGYTTTAEVDHKFRSRRRMQLMLKMGFFILFVIILILLYYKFDPIERIKEIRHIIGAGS